MDFVSIQKSREKESHYENVHGSQGSSEIQAYFPSKNSKRVMWLLDTVHFLDAKYLTRWHCFSLTFQFTDDLESYESIAS